MASQTLTTKEKILLAAGEIFGQKGFTDTTIRRICQEANVNVAAINYHFRDKEGLYSAVLEDVFQQGFTRFPPTLGKGPETDPKKRLRYFIRGMFYRLQSSEGWGGMSGHGRLIAREMLDPSPAFEGILEHYIKPHKDLLISIIAEIMGVKPDEKKLLPCAISILGQCVYYALASSVITKISPGIEVIENNLDHLADSVYHFSLGGIKNFKKKSFSKKRTGK